MSKNMIMVHDYEQDRLVVLKEFDNLEEAQAFLLEAMDSGSYTQPGDIVLLTDEEDDWDLGPACGLEPDICESCQ